MAKKKKQQVVENNLGFDNVEQTLTRTEQFLENNAKNVGITVGVIVALVLAYFGYNSYVVQPNSEEAAQQYANHALVLNIPLNQDLNHRLFEIMAAGVPQVIFGEPSLLGDNSTLGNREDLFWANSIEKLEELAQDLLAKHSRLQEITVNPPPYWDLKDLLKKALAP